MGEIRVNYSCFIYSNFSMSWNLTLSFFLEVLYVKYKLKISLYRVFKKVNLRVLNLRALNLRLGIYGPLEASGLEALNL